MTDTTMVRPDAGMLTDRYRALLYEGDAAATAARFVALQEERGLVYRGQPVCSTVQPRFLSTSDHAAFLEAGRIGARLVQRADEYFRSNAALRAQVFATHPYAGLLHAHDRFLRDPCGRFDALVDGEGRTWFIEYNAGLCGGLYFAEALAEAFRALPPMHSLAEETPLKFQPTSIAYVETLREAYARDFGGSLARIMFLLPDGPSGDLYAAHAEVRMMRAEMTRRGIDSRLVRISDARFDGHRIADGDWVADAVLVFDWLTLALQPAAAPLLTPRMTEGSWIINSLGAAVYRSGKHLFALMSDPAVDLGETAEDRAWIERHCPWTRIMTPGETTDDEGRRVDLVTHLRAERDHMVLKPSFAMGGRGVVLGWKSSPADWDRAIQAAAAEPYIVQRRVTMAAETYACPSGTSGSVADRKLESDLCCYIWHQSEAYGLHCRASDTGMMNLAGGSGSVIPVFVTG